MTHLIHFFEKIRLRNFFFSSEVLKIYIIFCPQSELATFKQSFLLWTVISLQPVGISF